MDLSSTTLTRNVMIDVSYLFVMITMMTTVRWQMAKAGKMEVCIGEDFVLSCRDSEILIIHVAEYGRKQVGRCIPEADQYIGCTNDVLPLLDRWCSGRQSCSFEIPNPDLEEKNKNCLRILRLYVEVEYSCMKVDSRCQSTDVNVQREASGHVTSYQADKKACGLKHSPWLISASPGQTITVTMTDFSAQSGPAGLVGCPRVYGVIGEKALGINHTICGGRERHTHVYTSKTNSIEMYFLPKSQRDGGQFVIEYKVTGCPELTRPAHAWYKREGNLAVIGCQANDNEWRLTCVGNEWIGEIGNCTDIVQVVPSEKTTTLDVKSASVVVMTGIAGGAVVLCVVAIVVGAVYINKYRLRQETKQLKKIYDETERSTMAFYGTRTLTLDPDLSGTLARPHGYVPPYSDQCTCATLPARSDASKTFPGSTEERQSLYSSIKST